MIFNKWLLGIGIGSVAAGALYLSRKQEAGEGLQTIVSPMIYKLLPLTINVDVLLKNTSKTPLKIKYPFVNILYKGVSIASSEIMDKDIELPAFQQLKINPTISIPIPIVSMFSLGGSLLEDLQKTDEVKIDILSKTYVYLGGNLKKIEQTEPYVIKEKGKSLI